MDEGSESRLRPEKKQRGMRRGRRIIPEWNGGGSELMRLEMAALRLSTANARLETAGKVRVSTVPMGALGSPWQPFMDREHA
nr:hypothetical protein Iba_chr03aCG9270 [Ipomoea batatas]GMC72109.1 hypothetical protein Iba_chr03bCG8460 [Ipomoea batatas]